MSPIRCLECGGLVAPTMIEREDRCGAIEYAIVGDHGGPRAEWSAAWPGGWSLLVHAEDEDPYDAIDETEALDWLRGRMTPCECAVPDLPRGP